PGTLLRSRLAHRPRTGNWHRSGTDAHGPGMAPEPARPGECTLPAEGCSLGGGFPGAAIQPRAGRPLAGDGGGRDRRQPPANHLAGRTAPGRVASTATSGPAVDRVVPDR